MKISISRSSVWTELCGEFEYYGYLRQCGFKYVDYDLYSAFSAADAPYLQPDWVKTAGNTREKMEKLGCARSWPTPPAGNRPRPI